MIGAPSRAEMLRREKDLEGLEILTAKEEMQAKKQASREK